jgi:hypothetical protein
MDNLMEKIAGLPPSSQLLLLAETAEKLAAERDAMAAELVKQAEENELDGIFHQLSDSGQCPWATRDEAMTELRKISSAGKIEALKASMDLLPGSIRKVASGLADMTAVADETRSGPNLKQSRERFMSLVESGGSSADE